MSELSTDGINFEGDNQLDFTVQRYQNVPEQTQEPENVVRPQHYTAGGIECIDAIESAIASINDPMEAFLTGQVMKYVWRFKLKNGVEDLQKAKWYLNRLIDKEKLKNEDNA